MVLFTQTTLCNLQKAECKLETVTDTGLYCVDQGGNPWVCLFGGSMLGSDEQHKGGRAMPRSGLASRLAEYSFWAGCHSGSVRPKAKTVLIQNVWS